MVFKFTDFILCLMLSSMLGIAVASWVVRLGLGLVLYSGRPFIPKRTMTLAAEEPPLARLYNAQQRRLFSYVVYPNYRLFVSLLLM